MSGLQHSCLLKPLFRFLEDSRMKRDVPQSKVWKNFAAAHLNDLRVHGLGIWQIKFIAHIENIGDGFGRALQSAECRFGSLGALVLVEKDLCLQKVKLWICGIQPNR